MLELTREHPLDRLRSDYDLRPKPKISELIESFLEVDRLETTALLLALRPLLVSDLERRRINRELAGRNLSALPNWLLTLDEVDVTATYQLTHVLGDGDDLFINLAWPDGTEMTVLIYVDHNMGTLVKDAMALPESTESLLDFVRSNSDDSESDHVGPLDPGQLRARVEQAIRAAEQTFDAPESDTWPGCRAVVEWACQLLPVGGTGYIVPKWTEKQRRSIIESFMKSQWAHKAKLSTNEQAGILESILWFGCDYPPGDPYRWSPVNVEILLADWYPRKVYADPEHMMRVPDVLRQFVSYCHSVRGIAPYLTSQTLQSLERWTPFYKEAVDARSQSPFAGFDIPPELHAKLRELGVDFDDLEDDDDDDALYWQSSLDRLARQVGGIENLDGLDAVPLPDEPFDWADIADDIRPRVSVVLSWTDRFCDEELDIEHRTVARRLLRRAALADPALFRRKSRDEYTAAAFIWLMGQFNDVFQPYGDLLVKDAAAFFGANSGSLSQKATTLLKALKLPGWDSYFLGTVAGDPALLHSVRRERIIIDRNMFREMEE